MDRAALLTPTERRIAELLAKGLNYRRVGPLLNMNPANVQAYTSRGIFKKLGVHSLPEFVRWWIYNVELPASTGGCPRRG